MTTPSSSPTADAQLPPQYDPRAVETQMRSRWDAAKAWHATPDAEGDPYSVVIPPPNVTAALHLGHALNNTLQDVLVRYHRMLGRNAMWMPGTDHAGIATQTVVEKRVLAEEGRRRTDFARDAFVEKIQAWKDEYEQRITDQLKEMGCSCDWDRQRFTMDEVCAAAVREAFFQLFKDGLIYRGKRLVNWDPVTQTALADDEVEMQEVDGHFWYMKYPVVEPAHKAADGIGGYIETGEHVTVATTRPETMLGDTAVAVNPDDPQRSKLIGKFVKLPIVGRVIPIIGDDYVVIPNPDSEDAKARMASGFLKVTPAHDPNDYDIGQRHHLPIINVMAPDASISKDHGWPDWDQCDQDALKPLLGLSREDARRAIVRWFREHDLLEDQKPYKHSVGHSYRSHVPIEPYYTDQWYVKVTDERLAGAALRAMAEDQRQKSDGCTWTDDHPFTAQSSKLKAQGSPDWQGKLRFWPDRYAKTFQTWHENIRDWCISRQLWWGHRIPVWHVRIEYSSVSPKSVEEIQAKRLKIKQKFEDAVRAYANARGLTDVFDVRFDLNSMTCFVCARSADAENALQKVEELHRAGQLEVVKPGKRVKTFEWPDFASRDARNAASTLDDLILSISQDPDVLDTWFSSALWPMSTMGWPSPGSFPSEIPEGYAVLNTWNPTTVLSTAREIITLWVSRMTMFNIYFRGCLPFHDVFIHAMIQDGHGQKMSKSLGNGVDPSDIIHSHGADAMRYTLTAMTTQTQDVRLPVDCVDPHTGETVAPKFITGPGGYKVMAPVQEHPPGSGQNFVTSYGIASGEVKPPESGGQYPVARNTSEKFDLGQRFANKLWNAVRFVLGNLQAQSEAPHTQQAPHTYAGLRDQITLADRWVLSRLARTVRAANEAIREYQFASYAQLLYDFFWRDVCDWYIEAIKPTVKDNPAQQRVLAAVLDASLRLLHPVMPFITERLWEGLNAACPQRGIDGLTLPGSDLLMQARWPRPGRELIDEEAERDFELIQQIVGAIREVRSTHNIPPRQQLETTAKAPGPIAQKLLNTRVITTTLANTIGRGVGPQVEKPDDAAVARVGDIELYIHGLVDHDAERQRLEKRLAELENSVATFDKRLSNESYVSKAPAKLVQETRDQREAAARERDAVRAQLEALA